METGADRGDIEDDAGRRSESTVPDPAVADGVQANGAPAEASVLDRIQDDLDDVERALERLDEGSYGTCQACGAVIDDEVLAGRPTTRFCAEHESAPASQGQG